MISFLKLIRLPNLLIIALTQYAIRYGVIYPIITRDSLNLSQRLPELGQDLITLQLSPLQFFLVVLATVFIAAAGYIINDYFDVKLDRINKPSLVLIDRKINRRFAIIAHWVFNILGVGIAAWIGYQIGLWKIGVIFLLSAGGLWFYSTSFKRGFLVGNILVSLFVALVPLIVIVYEVPSLIKAYSNYVTNYGIDFNRLSYFTLGFSGFSFLVNLIREIVKDAQDIEGDKAYGCRTLPIAWGLTKTKLVISLLMLITIAAAGFLQVTQAPYQAYSSIIYLALAVQLPLLIALILLFKAKVSDDFGGISKLMKLIMLLGLGYTLIIYFSFL